MGVSSGDRKAGFFGLGIFHEERGERFVESFHYLNEVLYENFSRVDSSKGEVAGAKSSPKTNKKNTYYDYWL